MSSIAIISLKYLEPEYRQTLDCINEEGLPVFFADRDGVGNMSRAFNDAFIKHIKGNYEFVWFVTNVVFAKGTAQVLAKSLRGNIVGVHPAMPTSDHPFQRPNSLNSGTFPVPFIEFTAPMFRADVFAKYLLDENLWYYYMDLELCHRLHMADYVVSVNHEAQVDHTYLRNSKTVHPVSTIRKQLRDIISKENKQYLNKKYGDNWPQLFAWKE